MGTFAICDNNRYQSQVQSFTACSNGTDALMVALNALDIGPNMRVAVPNMTFWAPFEAIALSGAQPVLIDIDPDDCQMSFTAFQEAHQRFGFDAAILVHLFGWTSHRLQDFRRYAREHNILLIEDAAQAFGVKVDNEPLLSQCLIGTLSFYPAKVIGAAGDAGGIVTSDIKLADRIKSLINHGRAGHYTYDYVGYNARSGGLQAMYLNRMLDIWPWLLETRLQAECFYHEFFSEYAAKNPSHPGFTIKHKTPPPGVSTNGYLNVLTIQSNLLSSDDVIKGLSQKRVGAARTYPQTLSEQPPARKSLRASDLKHSLEFSRNVLNLPLFAGMTPDEWEYAAQSLISVLNTSR